MLFGPSAEKADLRQDSQSSKEENKGSSTDNDPNNKAETEPTAVSEHKKRKGHGRIAANQYTGANKVVCIDDELKVNGQCPHEGCQGRLYDTKEHQEFIRFTARPIIDATLYQQEVLRCQDCGARFAAKLPEGVPAVKYDETADVMMALMKYAAGLPFYRLEKLQALMGTPLPASTQFMRCETVADSVYPIYLELARQASLGEVVCGDDTTVKILTCLKENKDLPKDARTGLQTTGIGALVGERTIALYYSGRRHTGENLYKLLLDRPATLDLPKIMGDAAAKNWTPEFQRIICKCLQHARKRFVEIKPAFAPLCQHVLDELGEVYKNESATKGMTPQQRLAYHQAASLPRMTKLKEWMEEQLREHAFEPNAGFGKAVGYFLDHYEGLTQFCKAAGAPLDNNLAERILKRAVLNRKNSYFYKTEHGAQIGDIIMSLVQTCAVSHINAFDYLLALLRNARAVRAAPTQWLPWNYSSHKAKEAA
jgi:hypothetical protein